MRAPGALSTRPPLQPQTPWCHEQHLRRAMTSGEAPDFFKAWHAAWWDTGSGVVACFGIASAQVENENRTVVRKTATIAAHRIGDTRLIEPSVAACVIQSLQASERYCRAHG